MTSNQLRAPAQTVGTPLPPHLAYLVTRSPAAEVGARPGGAAGAAGGAVGQAAGVVERSGGEERKY